MAVFSLCLPVIVPLCVSASGSKFPPLWKNTSHTGLEPVLMSLTMGKDAVSKQGHVHRYQRLGLQHLYGGTIQHVRDGLLYIQFVFHTMAINNLRQE